MKITDFLNENNVKWAYLSVSAKEDGGVHGTSYLDGNTYKSTDFNGDNWMDKQSITKAQTKTVLKRYKQVDRYRNRGDRLKSKVCQNGTTYIAYYPSNFAVIDVDDEKGFETTFAQHIDTLNNGMWYLSRGKRQKHYLVKLINAPVNPGAYISMKTPDNKCVGEVLISQPPWVRIDEKVHGTQMVEIDYHVFDKTPQRKNSVIDGDAEGMLDFDEDEVGELLDIFDISYWDNYHDWRAIGMTLKGLYGDDAFDLWDEMSEKSDKYGRTEYEWEHFNIIPKYCSERSLWKKAQQSDRKAFEDWVHLYDKPNSCFSNKFMPFSQSTLRMLTDRCNAHHIITKVLTEGEREIVEKSKWPDSHELVLRKSRKSMNSLYNYMNVYFCVVGGTSATYIFRDYEYSGRESVEKRVIYQNKKELENCFENFHINGDCIIKHWLKSRFRSYFNQIVFKPFQTDNKHCYNFWTGWVHSYTENFQVDTKLIQPVLHHWKEVLCNGSDKSMQYQRGILKLCLIGQKSGICIVVSGEQGDGKSLFFEYFGEKIIGDAYYGYVNSLEDVTNRFNNIISQKSFIVADEINTWSGDHKTANRLKSLITQTRQKFEKKGKDAINIDDFANYVFLSNHDSVVKVENKGDRRYACFKSSTKYKKNEKYFKRLATLMGFRPIGRASGLTKQEKDRADKIALHFMHYIMNFNLEGFNKEDIPQTDLRRELEANNTPDVIVFARWYLQRFTYRFAGVDEDIDVKMSDVFKAYVNFLDNIVQSDRKYGSVAPFSKRLRQLIPKVNERTKHTFGGTAINIDADFATSICSALDSKYTFTYAVQRFIKQNAEPELERITNKEDEETIDANEVPEDENVSETYDTIDTPPESVSSDDDELTDDESSSCEDEEDEYN